MSVSAVRQLNPVATARPSVNVLLIEPDPISRHVIQRHLLDAEGIRLIAAVERGSAAERYLGEIDCVVVSGGMDAGTECILETVVPLLGSGRRVLMLDTQWSRKQIETAVSVGVNGFIVKSPDLEGLSAGIMALAADQCVMSPGLLRHCFGSRLAADVRTPSGRHRLTEREREVLTLLSRGLSTQEAATRLRISAATVKSHVSHSLTKLGVRNRLEAVLLMQEP